MYSINKIVETWLSGKLIGSYDIPNQTAARDTYKGVNGGPVQVVNILGNPIVSSLRLLYKNAQGHITQNWSSHTRDYAKATENIKWEDYALTSR